MKWTILYCCITAGVLHASWLFAADTNHDSSELRCLDCHVTLPFEGVPLLFHVDTSAICLNCHRSYPCEAQSGKKGFTHPVAVVPSFEIPTDMPLDLQKSMGCITCHFFHDGSYGPDVIYEFQLRRPIGPNFCYTCHGKKLKR